ncbi:ABC transporter permease [Pseudonocardia spinosispora]|uniref:ABC transporter permease n=1 Tax=Pseudonocardia spinosispora TaxID=103441 RepID=UPI000418B17E|nr:ABC transporter permease [Pseudonocardia spinosispora]
MQSKNALRMTLHRMRANRLRTGLTTLTIMIGVAAMIVLIGLSNGVLSMVGTTLNNTNNTIAITPSTPDILAPKQGLDDGDLAALQRELDPTLVDRVVPVVEGAAVMRFGANEFRTAKATGSNEGLLKLRTRQIAAGSMFTEDQYRSKAKVALIGSSVVKWLFAGNSEAALGQNIYIGRHQFKVIGILAKSAVGNGVALVPMPTARAYLFGGTDSLNSISVIAKDLDSLTPLSDQISKIMDREHNIGSSAQRNYSADTTNTVASSSQSLTMLNWFIIAVAACMLLVGALGIANTILLTVSEHTEEIRQHIADGTPRSTIFRHVLAESTILAAFGGILGVGLGIGALVLVETQVMPELTGGAGAVEIPIQAVLIAFGASLLLGLLAGLYPATQAAKLSPAVQERELVATP